MKENKLGKISGIIANTLAGITLISSFLIGDYLEKNYNARTLYDRQPIVTLIDLDKNGTPDFAHRCLISGVLGFIPDFHSGKPNEEEIRKYKKIN